MKTKDEIVQLIIEVTPKIQNKIGLKKNSHLVKGLKDFVSC